jgi:hypothetical protein
LRSTSHRRQDAAKAKITCAVSIGPREGGGFGITVKLRVEDKSLKQAARQLRLTHRNRKFESISLPR